MPRFLLLVALVPVVCGMTIACDSSKPVSSPGRTDSPQSLAEGVVGTVRFARGAVAVGVLVQAAPVDPDAPPVPDVAIVTDELGRYQWRLTPGRYRISVTVVPCEPFEAVVTVAPREVTHLEVRLSCP